MSMSNSLENALLLLLLNNSNFANVGDATGLRGSTTAGSLYVSLHTADPGEAGAQNTSEIGYSGYARVALSRTGAAGWTVTGNSGSPTANIDFPVGTAGTSPTATHLGIGTSASGAGILLLSGAIAQPILCGDTITPTLTTATTIVFD